MFDYTLAYPNHKTIFLNQEILFGYKLTYPNNKTFLCLIIIFLNMEIMFDKRITCLFLIATNDHYNWLLLRLRRGSVLFYSVAV